VALRALVVTDIVSLHIRMGEGLENFSHFLASVCRVKFEGEKDVSTVPANIISVDKLRDRSWVNNGVKVNEATSAIGGRLGLF
jgi:hypothetical protein